VCACVVICDISKRLCSCNKIQVEQLVMSQFRGGNHEDNSNNVLENNSNNNEKDYDNSSITEPGNDEDTFEKQFGTPTLSNISRKQEASPMRTREMSGGTGTTGSDSLSHNSHNSHNSQQGSSGSHRDDINSDDLDNDLDNDDDTISVISAASSSTHNSSVLSLSKHGLRISKGSKLKYSNNMGDGAGGSSAAVVSRLKGEIAILRDSLDKLNATDVVTLNEKLRGAHADCRSLKHKNVELKNRIMSLEESLFNANAQLHQQQQLSQGNAGSTPRHRLSAARASKSAAVEEDESNTTVAVKNYEKEIIELKGRLQYCATEIATLRVSCDLFHLSLIYPY
jgi:hypothetical protein